MPPLFPPLQAIVDVATADAAGWDPLDLTRAFLDAGVRFLQVRAKLLPFAALLELCDRVVERAQPYDACVIVNDRVDVARMAGAAGVHVGQDDLPPAAARALLGPSAVIGYSTHAVSQIEAAVAEPISYIAVGPVFSTRTKETGYSAVGLDLVAAAAQMWSGPVVAIGGITLENAPSVIRAGATAVAVIGDLLVSGNPGERARAYLQALASHRV